MQVEDSEILSKFALESTRNEAFSLLLKKYQQKIYWHIRRLVIDHDDTDDLVQEVFSTYGKACRTSGMILNFTPGYIGSRQMKVSPS